jgi:hypothetical protein
MAKKLTIKGRTNSEGKELPVYAEKAKGWGLTRSVGNPVRSPRAAAMQVASVPSNDYSKGVGMINMSQGDMLKRGIKNMAKKLKLIK